MLKLGCSRQFWRQICFSKFSPDCTQSRRKWIQNFRNTKAQNTNLWHTLNTSEGCKSSKLLRFTLQAFFICPVLQPHSSLHCVYICNSTRRLCSAVRFLNGATTHRSYLFQWPPEVFCLKFKDQMVVLRTASQHWKMLGTANKISKFCNLLPLWSGYKRKSTRR